jgi:hypothetical protein
MRDGASDALWTVSDLAAFLGYKPSTVTRMVGSSPEALPPRVAAIAKPRWVPAVCRRWAAARGKESARARRAAGVSLPIPLNAILRKAVPFPAGISGVYFLLRGGSVVYVGRSADIGARLGQHAKGKDFDSFAWLPCNALSAAATERQCIEALDPPLNRDHTTAFARRVRALGRGEDG